MDLVQDDAFWQTTFAVYPVDLDRIVRRLQRTREAVPITPLVKRLIRGRLRYGPERAEIMGVKQAQVPPPHGRLSRLPTGHDDRPVRLWDPAAAWHEGDLAIFAVPILRHRLRSFSPTIGEVVKTQGNSVLVRIDGHPGAQVFGTTRRGGGGESLAKWRSSVEGLVAILRNDTEESSHIDYIFWRHGVRIVELLLNALREDPRFVTHNNAWFLAELAVQPSDAQLVSLARAMLFETRGALGITELLHLMPPPVAEGDAGRFGLILAARERPDLFTNVDVNPRSRWVLAGPPPGLYTARLAAYDPESYTVLCEPGDTLSVEVVQRLWDLDLLAAVAERATAR